MPIRRLLRAIRLPIGLIALLAILAVQAADDAAAEEMLGSACPASPCGDLSEYSCPPPRCPWYARSEGLAMIREVQESIPVASFGPTPNRIVLHHNDLGQPFSGGVRAVLGHTFGDSPHQIEFSYFTLSQWETSTSVVDGGALQNGVDGYLYSPFTNFGNPAATTTVDKVGSIAIQELSYLDNAELNWKRVLPMPSGALTPTLVFGVRHVGIREEFDYFSRRVIAPSTLSDPITVTSKATNDLWGPQLGGLFELNVFAETWVSFEIKGAICSNSTTRELGASIALPDDSHGRFSRNVTAYVADFNLSAFWKPTAHLATRFGYQAMWVGGLVLAAENFAPDLGTLQNSAIQPPLNQNGTVLYHGPYAGMELSW